ncbi:MAG: hypothetical protein WC608_02825 [Parcubacteria group bacterium]
MEKGDKKRLIIIAVYAAIFIGVVFLIYQWQKPAPNCFDGKQNQNEEGLDCGGVCAKKCPVTAKENLIVRQTGFVESGIADSYDVYAEVANPNSLVGSDKFSYKFSMKNAAGEVMAEPSGTSFILPADKKYIVETNIATKETPASVEMIVSDPRWVETNDTYEKPELKIVSKNYNEITSGVGFGEAIGLLKNESPFDFNSVKLRILLKDEGGKVIAINSTQMNTVNAGENRDFRVSWPNKFPGSVSQMDVQAEVNVFDSEAFVKKYFMPGKFQQYQ